MKKKFDKNLIPPTFNLTLLLRKRDLEKSLEVRNRNVQFLESTLKQTLRSQKDQEEGLPYLGDLDMQSILSSYGD